MRGLDISPFEIYEYSHGGRSEAEGGGSDGGVSRMGRMTSAKTSARNWRGKRGPKGGENKGSQRCITNWGWKAGGS
jgi:hypothetical protein